jgi:hypothetical protein
MAKLLNSSQPKWLFFKETANIVTVPVGDNPQMIQIKSEAQGQVNVALHQAGHTGTLPVVTANKDINVELSCANGDEAFIINEFMKWITAAGTDAVSANNQRYLKIVGTASTITEAPDMFEGKITNIVIDFDATS